MFEQWANSIDEYWILWVFAIVLATLVLHFVVRRVLAFLIRRAENSRSLWDDALFNSLRGPLDTLIWLIGIHFAAFVTATVGESDWISLLEPIDRTGVILLIAWMLIRFIKRAEYNLTHEDYERRPMDETTAKALRKLLQAAIIITAILIILQNFGYSISGVLAFGGIGGIAVGFAARDLLANFFGAMMIYLDKPFSVGDWVRSPDKEIEGVVEDIGWRLTVIRTFDKRPLYVPNAIFNQISLENPSRMQNRRIYETIGIRYDDFSVLAPIVDEVRAMLKAHEELDTEPGKTLIVNFDRYGASSLDFFIYTFTRTTNWIEYHRIKQDVLLRIGEIIEKHGAEIAFPTSTVHLPDLQQPQSPVDSAAAQPEKGGREGEPS